ncbi:MAG: ferredoxin-type protein NapF [Gammaproteobacteria bacterium]
MSRISRFDFLRGDFSGKRTPIRPPWACLETEFVEKCTRCDECVSACPEKIITTGRGGFPAIDFHLGECTFCGDCVVACKEGALHAVDGSFDDRSAWKNKASILTNCLALNGVECRVCGEQCESQAIRFQLVAGGVARPRIDHAACNGCGACVAPCPTDAVFIRAVETDAHSTTDPMATAV